MTTSIAGWKSIDATGKEELDMARRQCRYSQQRRASVSALSRPRLDPLLFYASELEGFNSTSKAWASARCPFHDDENPSFGVNLETGGYVCRSTSCGAKGGSIVSFVMARYGLNYREAISRLGAWQ